MNVVHLASSGWALWPDGAREPTALPSLLHGRCREGDEIDWSVSAGRKKGGAQLDLRRDLPRVWRLQPQTAPGLLRLWWTTQTLVPSGPTLVVAPLEYFPGLARDSKLLLMRECTTFLLEEFCLLAGAFPALPAGERLWLKQSRNLWLEVQRSEGTLTLARHTRAPAQPGLEPGPEGVREGALRIAEWARAGGPRTRFRIQPTVSLSPSADQAAWARLQPQPGAVTMSWTVTGDEGPCDLTWSLGEGPGSLLHRLNLRPGAYRLHTRRTRWSLEWDGGSESFAAPSLAV